MRLLKWYMCSGQGKHKISALQLHPCKTPVRNKITAVKSQNIYIPVHCSFNGLVYISSITLFKLIFSSGGSLHFFHKHQSIALASF